VSRSKTIWKLAVFLCLFSTSVAFAACPDGTWSRDQYDGPGGGLSTGPSGGLSTGPGGGMSDGPTHYCSNIPPWSVFLKYLFENGYEREANLIRAALQKS